MSYALSFNSYSFPAGFHVSVEEMESAVPAAKLPRRHGARIPLGYLGAKKFKIRGAFVDDLISNTGGLTVRQSLDALKAALMSGPADFATDTDRFWPNCQKVAYSDSYDPTMFNRFASVEFDLVAPDPISFEVATQNASRSLTMTGQTLSITPGGNAQAMPQISVTAGATGTLAATIMNAANGDMCSLSGAVTMGDVLILDSLLEQVTRSGSDITSFFDGMWIRLEPGIANVLTVAWTLGSLSNIAVAWQNRWY